MPLDVRIVAAGVVRRLGEAPVPLDVLALGLGLLVLASLVRLDVGIPRPRLWLSRAGFLVLHCVLLLPNHLAPERLDIH